MNIASLLQDLNDHLGDLYCLSIDNQYQTNALNLRKSKNEKSDKESLSEVCKGHVRDSLISPYNYKASLTCLTSERMNLDIFFLVLNVFVFLQCNAAIGVEFEVHPKSDTKVFELRHNVTDFDDSGGLPYKYREKFLTHGLIQDVIFLAPKNILKVKWGWKNIFLGTKMLAEKLREPPQLSWPTERGVLYTLIMTGPDFPTRENPAHREWIYWRVGNIPENDVHYGDVIDGYCGPSMCFEPMPRRFLLLVYKQPVIDKCIQFEEIKKRQVIFHERAHFSTLRFAEKYGFDIYAHAGNFFLVDGINTKV
ncbi:26 kDa secreted antigen isoform X3 [Bemisia tabaci]|uniref:26 kDa secreted antigen isoform X3 n=1 Tax=Bemisia tabaci TaxID=7038 RepID=UPI003B289E57